jgi:hypothetical protein
LKNHRDLFSAPVEHFDESEFAKYYITRLFRRNHHSSQTRSKINEQDSNTDNHKNDVEVKTNTYQYIKKWCLSIYHWDDDCRSTTMATCTYTVAIIFLYYLTCTFVFLYVSRALDPISFLRSYLEVIFDIGK